MENRRDEKNMFDLIMCEIFNVVALKVSNYFGYNYNQKEYNGVVEYLTLIRKVR